MSEAQQLKGTERAALLLMTLGEADAAEVLKYMGPREVQSIGTAMASLKNISRDQANVVLDRFITEVEEQTAFGVGTEDYVRKVLTGAFGAGKANAFIDRIMIGQDARGLDELKWMSSKDVAEIVDGEHPQIVAIIIAYLDSEQAAEVIGLLPEELRTEVLIRIARLSDVQQSALAEIENLIANKSSNKKSSGSEKVGGDKVAANIINSLGSAKGEEILEKIKERNEDLSNRIQEMMFVFDTLLNVDDRGIQSLLREVSNDLLVVALKGCDPAVRDKILRNMSKRAAALLSEDMEARGPIKLSEVEIAQKEILDIARRMADAGDLDLGQGGEEYV
ncbi:flagellar motor switch protein FliG [Woeseia oceani]|uniref:Flagellar motor switch protein FliG n=1 Tax=Woeseia oceani TaxID=1548547 RepID=A0A193LEW2_9GAMM|nr:flagellar motor switch protein FliG [Woeseia oceani]ANO51047.1 flagellar motor switch protein FliG [Woeseia oceani]